MSILGSEDNIGEVGLCIDAPPFEPGDLVLDHIRRYMFYNMIEVEELVFRKTTT